MNPIKLKDVFLRSRTLSAQTQINNKPCEVRIDFPNLDLKSLSLWGDWGPMATALFSESQTFKVNYSFSDSKSQNAELSLSQIQLKSPIFYLERQKHPFYFHLIDQKHGYKLKCFLTESGDLGKLKVSSAPLKMREKFSFNYKEQAAL